MKRIIIKLKERIHIETVSLLMFLKSSRSNYINDELELINKHKRRKFLAKQIAKESKLVSADSMAVLFEFESLQNET